VGAGAAVLRRALLALALLGLLAAGGGIAVARSTPALSTSAPTSVTGTDGTAVFTIADRTVRQVRYADGGTLRYTFRLVNESRLPVTVRGLAEDQPPSRLFTATGLTGPDGAVVDLPAGEAVTVTLALLMSGCETLSSRAGSFASEVVLRTEQAGVFHDDVRVTLPEEVHTGSPREASCPGATATSRSQG
jgi:hypothetical protein